MDERAVERVARAMADRLAPVLGWEPGTAMRSGLCLDLACAAIAAMRDLPFEFLDRVRREGDLAAGDVTGDGWNAVIDAMLAEDKP